MTPIDNIDQAHKFWSVRLTIALGVFWAIVLGLWVALPAFIAFFPPFIYALICIGFSVAIVVARLTHQPGLE